MGLSTNRPALAQTSDTHRVMHNLWNRARRRPPELREPLTSVGTVTPLQRIAMGLVVVVLSAPVPPHPDPAWARYDLLADPVGWLLMIGGTWSLARLSPAFRGVRLAALVAGAVSLPMWFPQLRHHLDAPALWALSLPQIAACLLLVRAIGDRAAERRPPEVRVQQRAGVLAWGLVVIALLPVVVIGGKVQALEGPTAALALLVNLALIWTLFSYHRRRWLGGPGPLEVAPAQPGTRTSTRPPGKRRR